MSPTPLWSALTGRAVCFAGLTFLAAGLLAQSSMAAPQEENPPAAAPDVRFKDFPEDDLYPGKAKVEQLLGHVPGEKSEINERTRREQTTAEIDGLFRLTPSWRADETLRLEIIEPRILRLYLWHGTSGLSVEYRREAQNTWAVYGATRNEGGHAPEKRTLWATDSGRYRRSGAGNVDLTIRDGRLVLSRGDLRLLSVPIDGPPDETYLECTGVVRGLAWLPAIEVPPPLWPPGPASLATRRPAELKWESELDENCRLATLPDGQVELSTAEKGHGGRAWIDVGPPRLREFLFEVDQPEPGSGIWLGDDEGREICRVGFYEGPEQQTVFVLTYPGDSGSRKSFDARRQIVPYAGARLWLRLTVGGGASTLWSSIDGVDWSQPSPTSESVSGGCRRVGLYVTGRDRPATIRLRAFEIHQFDAIDRLVPQDLLARAEAFPKVENVDEWDRLAAESRPQDVPADAWTAASALATLAAGPRESVGRGLLDRLVLRAVPEQADEAGLESLSEILDEAGLVYSSRDWNAGEQLQRLFDRVGLALGQRGYSSPFSLASAAMMRSPFWQDRRLEVFSDRLLRYELFVLVGDRRWDAIDRLSRRMEFWNHTPDRRDGQPPWSDQARYLIGWAAARAAAHGAGAADATATIAHPRWGDALVTRFSKEGYNVLAEMDEALRAGALDEACRSISGSVAATGGGLLPDGRDSRLSVSLDVAIADSMRAHPALAQTMVEKFAPVGDIRLKEATARADADAVAVVARQFPGTPVAAAAHAWLGDRDLAAGRFGPALTQYAAALSENPNAADPGLLARRRLAGAMLGQDLGEPATSAVTFGKTRLSPQQFETLADELRKAHAPTLLAAKDQGTTKFVPPGEYTLRRLSRVEVQGAKYFGDRSINWAGRQMAVLATDQAMIVSGRSDVAALDPEQGSARWADRPDLGDRARRWPLETMRPLVGDGRIVLRRLTEDGLTLACLDAVGGRPIWTAGIDGVPVCDPLVSRGELLVLAAAKLAGSTLAISLAAVDPATGRVLRQEPVAEFHDVWDHQIPCRMTAADGLLAATIGGYVLAFDREGRLRWVRRQVWMPPPGDYYNYTTRYWIRQIHEPPIVADGRVYATQVGVWGVECVDLNTGQLVWRTPVCDLERPVGLASGLLIVQTTTAVTALDAADGRIAWSHDVEHPQQAAVDGAGGVVFCCRTERPDGDKKPGTLELDWLDGKTGQLQRQSRLTMPVGLGPLVGPVISRDGRAWVFICPSKQEGWQDLFRLEPAAESGQP